MLKAAVKLQTFVQTVKYIFSGFSDKQHLFETEIFCNIVHLYTVTFDQLNVFAE